MNGLTEEEVIVSRRKYGSNALTREKQDTFLSLLLSTFADPIIKILLIALAIKTVFLFKNFDWYETLGIVIAILFASLISTISEYGSAKAFNKLQEESSALKAMVIRNGQKKLINSFEVVVGDILVLESGMRVIADGKVIDGQVYVDESSLNGEAREIKKQKGSLVYQGTVIYNGEALLVVTQVGDNTMYGQLALELQVKQQDTPLKIRLNELAQFISKIGYIGACLVFVSHLFSAIVIQNNFNINLIMTSLQSFPFLSYHVLYALTLSVAIIIVAVPEGLPMMITLVLSSNMKRMLKSNVLVRKLIGIETAGNIDILFTDKTGTITNGKLEVVGIMSSSLKLYNTEQELKKFGLYEAVANNCILNNQSSYANGSIIGGNITDQAIRKFFSINLDNKKVLKKEPFDSAKKYMKTTLTDQKVLLKGAMEVLVDRCRYCYDDFGKKKLFFDKNKAINKIKQLSKTGQRVVVMAESVNENVNNLIYVGAIIIKDNVRQEAYKGIELIKRAHINIVMITGDNKETAMAIGKEVGLYQQDDLVLTSDDLCHMSDIEIKKVLPRLRIVARALPHDKSRLVRLSQELGLVVAMTGDGVNDAPALKCADVGFSMGSGTEVAREASDIVILDNNIMSISKAILYGRTIFKSIRKFIILQLTINMCALCLTIIGPFTGIDSPITVIQMLWINMVMDTLAGLAFSFEPALEEYMDEYPKKKNEKIINKYMINQILYSGLYATVLCVLFLKIPYFKMFYRNSDKYLYTAFFGLFIFIDIFNSFNARTHRINVLANILKNRVFIVIMSLIFIIQMLIIYKGGSLFRTYGLNLAELELMILLASTVVPFDWLRKISLKQKKINTGV